MGLFSRRPPTKVGAADALEMVRDDAVLVDVRDSREWKAGRAPYAIHIPMDRLSTSTKRLPTNKTVIVICKSGARSSRAASQLRKEGFNALSLAGGMHAWERAGGNVVRDGGAPGRIA